MNSKEYKLPDGRTALFLYDENGIGQITLEAMDSIMSMITGKWIPCSERLPEDDEIMLVTCKPKKGSPNVNRAYYMDGAWHGSGSMSNVTAWMSLPKPYQEDKQ